MSTGDPVCPIHGMTPCKCGINRHAFDAAAGPLCWCGRLAADATHDAPTPSESFDNWWSSYTRCQPDSYEATRRLAMEAYHAGRRASGYILWGREYQLRIARRDAEERLAKLDAIHTAIALPYPPDEILKKLRDHDY